MQNVPDEYNLITVICLSCWGVKAAFCWMKITLAWGKKITIYERPFQHFITIFLLSFDLSLSCKLQLIDLITVFAAFLVSRQTILVSFFFRERRNRTWKRQMDGKIKVTATGRYRYTSHVLSVKLFAQYLKMQLKNDFFYIYSTSRGHVNTIISRRACVIIWCPECFKWHFRASRILNFLGEYAPGPP